MEIWYYFILSVTEFIIYIYYFCDIINCYLLLTYWLCYQWNYLLHIVCLSSTPKGILLILFILFLCYFIVTYIFLILLIFLSISITSWISGWIYYCHYLRLSYIIYTLYFARFYFFLSDDSLYLMIHVFPDYHLHLGFGLTFHPDTDYMDDRTVPTDEITYHIMHLLPRDSVTFPDYPRLTVSYSSSDSIPRKSRPYRMPLALCPTSHLLHTSPPRFPRQPRRGVVEVRRRPSEEHDERGISE